MYEQGGLATFDALLGFPPRKIVVPEIKQAIDFSPVKFMEMFAEMDWSGLSYDPNSRAGDAFQRVSYGGSIFKVFWNEVEGARYARYAESVWMPVLFRVWNDKMTLREDGNCFVRVPRPGEGGQELDIMEVVLGRAALIDANGTSLQGFAETVCPNEVCRLEDRNVATDWWRTRYNNACRGMNVALSMGRTNAAKVFGDAYTTAAAMADRARIKQEWRLFQYEKR